MKKGKEGTGGRKNSHDFVHVVTQVVEKGHLVNLSIFQYQWKILYRQNAEVSGKAEGHLGEHGVNIGMPEYKPSPQRLSDIETQNHQGRNVTVKPNEHSEINDVLQLIFADKIS